ncbi:nostrin [Caerostris extrusa]|uniref:Nostrin n=1 Tax=Caerostris extrusa TaxID=172846 RepID=A0AAV4VUF9_CAEEX|nr:nostrin [Caerostris extrusa]
MSDLNIFTSATKLLSYIVDWMLLVFDIFALIERTEIGPNGFEELRKSIKEGQDFTKDIAAILHERSELEITYAKHLSKLAAKINKVTRLTLGTTQHAWQEVALQMENEADTHRCFSSSLEEDVVKPIKVLLECQHKQRKILENSVDKVFKTLNDRRNEELKAKKLSYACARENERMQEQAVDCKLNKGKLLTEKDIHKQNRWGPFKVQGTLEGVDDERTLESITNKRLKG